MISLDCRIDDVTRCTHDGAWKSRVLALHMTLNHKLLDSLRRPIRENKVKDLKYFHSVISDSGTHVSTDGDAELLEYVLQYSSHKVFCKINEVSRAWIHPSSYDVLHPNNSRQSFAMVFASFKYLVRNNKQQGSSFH